MVVATPALVALSAGLSDRLSCSLVGCWVQHFEAASATVSEDILQLHLPMVGFGVTGRNLARSCRSSDLPYAVVELNAALMLQARADDRCPCQASVDSGLVNVQRARAVWWCSTTEGPPAASSSWCPGWL